jgi:hypothetical protein
LFEKQKPTFLIVEHVGYRTVGGCVGVGDDGGGGENDKEEGTVFYIIGITALGSNLYT